MNVSPGSTTATPNVLVLLATRNGASWIREQLQSIAGQEDVVVDLAVSDDCSTDGTPQLIGEFSQKLRIDMQRRSEPSGSAAQNFFSLIRSSEATTYDFVAFADQDDVWAAGKLARACASLASGARSGYSSSVTAFWPNGRERQMGQSTRQSNSDFLFEGAGQGCTFVLTAPFYNRVRALLCEHPNCTAGVHYHDWAIYALCRVWGLQWHFDAVVTMRYRQHGTNDTGARTSIAGIVRRFRLIKSGWYTTQLGAIAQVCCTAAPGNLRVLAWQQRLHSNPGISRKSALFKTCLSGGRRRLSDNVVVLFSIALGWI